MEDNPTPIAPTEDINPETAETVETSETAEASDISEGADTSGDLIADLRRQLRDANVRIRYLEGAVGRAERIAYDRARAELIEEAYTHRVNYYRNLRDAGARAAGRMPDSTPAPLLMAVPRRGFWD